MIYQKIINIYFILNTRTIKNSLATIELAILLIFIMIFIQICEHLQIIVFTIKK